METGEEARLRTLAEYSVLDTPPEPEYDRLVALAAHVFNVPVALITLVDRDRQFFKAKVGTEVCETPRAISFCAHALTGSEPLVVADATTDCRFSCNPLVTGEPHIRFYAGAPLVARGGHVLGTLCVIDFERRPNFGEAERKILEEIAALAMQQMELSRLRQVEKNARQAREKLANSERNFRLLVESVTDYAIYMLDRDGIVTNWNPGAQRFKGYAAHEIVGHSFARFYTEEDRAADLPKRALQCAATEGRFLAEGWRVRKDGSRFWASVVIDPIRDETGALIGFAKITRDVTDRRIKEERLHHLAHVDTLTGLPNRLALTNQLEELVKSQVPAAVLMLDLDGFKQVNDTLGHATGDAVLKAAAQRIGSAVDERGRAGRFGGDEFAVVLTETSDLTVAAAVCEQLLAAFHAPFCVGHEDLHLGLSIGVALFPQHGNSAEELLGNADLALYRAKDEGRHGYSFFQPAMRQVALARRSCERELHNAFEDQELEIFFQPQVRLSDRQLVGAEALLRWRHPQRGVLAPGAFLDVLERSSLAQAVGTWTLKKACAFASAMRQRGHRDFRVAVNLFDAQFRRGQLVQSVLQALRQNGLAAEALELEITENTILQHNAEMLAPLQQLRAHGIGIAFDDYGTGYASLSLLKKFPLARLKIDKSFVGDLCTHPEDAAVIKAILYLADSFGLDVLAEGVEEVRQETALRDLGCKHAQGYLFGRPMPAEQFFNSIALACKREPASLQSVALAS